MKWGVRKDLVAKGDVFTGVRGIYARDGSADPTKTDIRRSTKVVRKIESDLSSDPKSPFKNGDVYRIGQKHLKPGVNSDATIAKMHKEVSEVLTVYANTKTPSGAVARIDLGTDQSRILVGTKESLNQFLKDEVAHSATFELVTASFKLSYDESGFITGMVSGESLEQGIDDSDDDILAHYGRLGMKWGVRRPTNSSGIVTGSVAGAIKGGQTPVAGSASPAPVTKGSKSTDQVKMEENITKKLEQLSTADIREITNRIKAINENKTTTAAEAAKKASMAKKLTDFALKSVVAGAKKSADNYIQELTDDVLKDILPKTKTQKAKDAKEQEKKADKEAKSKKEQDQARSTAADKATPAKTREDAVKDLVYTITSLPEKKEG